MRASRAYLVPRIVTLDTASVSVPGSLGFGAGLTAVTVPATTAPAGITTWPRASLTSSTTFAVRASPAWLVREVIVSLTAMSRCVPAGAVYVVGAGGVTGLGRATGGRTAGVGCGTGASCRAALVSLGASVRLRAVESVTAAALDRPPWAQAAARAKDRPPMRTFRICASSLCASTLETWARFSVVLAEPILQDGDTGGREKFPCSPFRYSLQPVLEELRRESLQVARQ